MNREKLNQIKADLLPVIKMEKEFLKAKYSEIFNDPDCYEDEDAWEDFYEEHYMEEFKNSHKELYAKYPEIICFHTPTQNLIDDLEEVVEECGEVSLNDVKRLIIRLRKIQSILELWEE